VERAVEIQPEPRTLLFTHEELDAQRTGYGLARAPLARRPGSTPSGAAGAETSDASAFLDLLERGPIASGASRSQDGRAIVGEPGTRAGSAGAAGNAARHRMSGRPKGLCRRHVRAPDAANRCSARVVGVMVLHPILGSVSTREAGINLAMRIRHP
jgi:hypothetical protein